ncbi:hypothetical protein ABZ599_37540 [Streptomyces misionensis]|uniref:hypothetical protein n=1 Tax=Streptomyces misionensis TaxID=67331 RepID=UPI0033C2AFAA
MFEIDGQTFREDDIVRFSRAGMSQNRVRDYQIDVIHPDLIQVSANGIRYTYSRAEVASLGIIHAADHDDEK